MTPASAPTPTPEPVSAHGKAKQWLWVVAATLLLSFAGCALFGSCSPGTTAADSSTVVETPEAEDQQPVVDGLARASAAHGICYGWRLQGSGKPLSTGSNLGAGKAVTDDPKTCAKYIEVQGNVYYFPDSSDSEDYATWTIRSNLPGASKLDPSAFDRLGADVGKLLDDPASTILVAVDALPLLAQEAGLVTGAVPEPSLTGSPEALDPAGNDFLRDRWPLLTVAGGFLLVALVALVAGVRATRAGRNGEGDEKPAPPA